MKRTIALSAALALLLVFAQGAQAQDTKRAEPKEKIEAKAEPKKAPAEPKADEKVEPKKDEKVEPKAEEKKTPAPPPKDEVKKAKDDPGKAMAGIVTAAQSGQWALMVAFIVMLLTTIVRKLFKDTIPAVVLPWVAVGLGLIGECALVLAYGGSWPTAILAGVSAGLTAGGGYSALGKHLPFIGLKKEEAPAAEEKPKDED